MQQLQPAEPEPELRLPEPERLRTVQQERHILVQLVRRPEQHSLVPLDRRPPGISEHTLQVQRSWVPSEHTPVHRQPEPHSWVPSRHRRV